VGERRHSADSERFSDLADPSIVRDRATRAAREGWNAAQFLYTAEWSEAKAAIRSGHRNAIEAAVVFLEIDPWCFDSGYQKADLYSLLAGAPLSDAHQTRLRAVVLRRLIERRGRSNSTLRHLAHLANALWTPEFHELMSEIPRAEHPAHAVRELRFLALAVHGHQASVRWGRDHDANHPAEFPVHVPAGRGELASGATVRWGEGRSSEGLFFEL